MSDLLNDLVPAPSPDSNKSSYSAKDIEVLEGLEPVRKRPGMYVGGTDERALHHLASEIIDNAMDEAVAGYASHIKIHLDADGCATVTDNGRGIPVDPHPKYKDKSALEVILTTLHSGGKFSGKAYATSGGLHGVGISVVNALSDLLVVEVARDKSLYRQTFSRGLPQDKLERVGAAPNRRGTSVRFHPDPEIFGEKAKLKADALYRFSRSKAFLQKGVEIRWSCDPSLLDKDSKTPAEAVLHFPGGLADSLQETVAGESLVTPILYAGEASFSDDQGRMEWAIAWLDQAEASVGAFCNTIPTPLGGTHEQGLRSGLTRALKGFGDLAGNKKAANITPDDVMGAARSLLSVFIRDPQFQGQTKDRLTSSYVTRLVDNAIKDQLDHWLAQHPKEAKALLDNVVLRAEERQRRRQAKDSARKTATSRLRLPGKLADCSRANRADTEIFLVEGDSAGGSAKQARNRETQAILPLRGKILNVASATADKLQANQELSDLSQALGVGLGRQFKLDDLRYERVIIMTDADVDGAHIASLLMTFFYREMRPLIEAGRLFLAMPPLYRLSQGGKVVYARDDNHKDELVAEVFKANAKIEISRFKGLGEMSSPQLKVTTMNPATRQLLQVRLDDFRAAAMALGSDMGSELASESADQSGQNEDVDQLVEDLMGRKPERRFAFIQENAAFAEDLDI